MVVINQGLNRWYGMILMKVSETNIGECNHFRLIYGPTIYVNPECFSGMLGSTTV